MSDEITVKPRTETTPTATPSETPVAAAVPEKPSTDLSPYLILCAAGLLASFFMPWIKMFLGHPSGYDLQQLGDAHKLYWGVPVFAAVAIVAALTKKSQRTAAQFAGAVPYVILIYWMAKFESKYMELLQNLDYGAYVGLVCGGLLEFLGRRVR